MVLVVRVRPVHIERLIFVLVIIGLLFSNYHFYQKAQTAVEENTIIVSGSQETNLNAPQESFQDLDIEALESEVKERETQKAQEQQTSQTSEETREEPQETCSDGKKNQDEEEVDCGGVCDPCQKETVIPDSIPSSGVVEFSIDDHTYEWKESSKNAKLTNVKVSIFNDLGKDIDDGVLLMNFYGESDDLDLKNFNTEVELPSIKAGTSYKDILLSPGSPRPFSLCCKNNEGDRKTLRITLQSKEQDVTITKKVTVDG